MMSRFRRRALRVVAIACLFVACTATTPLPRYVIGGQGGEGVQWLVLAPCSQAPHGWPDARAYCDFSALTAVSVTPEVYIEYDQGEVYP